MDIKKALDKSVLLYIMYVGEDPDPERMVFACNHPHLILRTSDQYKEWPCNEHHITTNFAFNTLLPNLADLLKFQYNPEDYVWKNVNVMVGQKTFDISRLVAKEPGLYHVKCFTIGNEFTTDFSGLGNTSVAPDLTGIPEFSEGQSAFHKMYVFGHLCSKVENMGKNNGRRLLISGDSQMIPLIPILSCIYKEVWYLDNRRYDFSMKFILDKEEDFDDVLIAAPGLKGTWPRAELNRYLVDNFR